MNTQLLSQSWLELQDGSLWKKYAADNPGESAALKAYVFSIVAGSPIITPALRTHTGKGLAGTLAAMLAPAPWKVDPPRDPITRLTNEPGLGVNIQRPEVLADYVIDGTGDSAVLLQQQAAGSQLSRFHITRACALPGPSYPRHAFYIAVRDVTLDNIWASVTPGPNVGQCFSVRCGGFTLTDFYAEGAPHLVGYFEQDDQDGDVILQGGRGSFTDDCAVYIDGSKAGRRFVLRDIHALGNGPVVKTGKAFQGVLDVKDCDTSPT